MSMRITKYPSIISLGLMDLHAVDVPQVPPSAVPPPTGVKIPIYPWIALANNPVPAWIFGKFTLSVRTDFLFDILFGHDWGIMQGHFAPPFVATPSMLSTFFGASHKYFLPNCSVQETPGAGALSRIGASGTPVAVSLPCCFIVTQHCCDFFVLPVGKAFELPTTRWVGFTLADLLAGVIAMAGDALSSAVSSALGNAVTNGLQGFESALVGSVFSVVMNVGSNAFQNALGSDTPSDAIGIGILAGPLAIPGGIIGWAAGKGASAVGGNETLRGVSLA
jgi:hypothetical protein